MEIRTYQVFKFEELKEEAKQRALQDQADFQASEFKFEWDCIKDDAKNIGLELTEWEYCRDIKGEFIGSALECAEKIIKEHGKKCETYKTARKYLRGLKLKTEEKRNAAEDDFLQAILEDYRIMTDKQFEFVQSEEACKEAIEANDYRFLENGKID